MTSEPISPLPRFWPLFLLAIALRVLVVSIGLALVLSSPSDEMPKTKEEDPVPGLIRSHILAGSSRMIEPWFRWDAGWYVNVAENGYVKAADRGGRLGVAYLPAMPLCMASAAAIGLNPFWAAMILGNLAAAAGTAVFTRLAVRLTGDRGTGLRGFAILTAYPASFFLSAPYNESFGLLFSSLALSAWIQVMPVRAGLFAALGSLARLTGVTMGIAALGAWLLEDRSWAGFRRASIFALGSFLGLALFWGYLGWAVGDFFAGLKAHSAWGRRGLSISNPWLSIQSIYDPEVPHWFEGAVVFLFIALGIRAWAKRGSFWGLVTLLPIAQMMMSGTLLSGHRLVLAALPGFIELADLLRNRLVFLSVVVLFACIQFELLNRYLHWVFVG